MDKERFQREKSRRWPYRSQIRWASILMLILGVGALLAPLKGLRYNGPEHNVALLVSIGVVLTCAGAGLYALWWMLAGRRAEQVGRVGGVTFQPAATVPVEPAAPEIQRPVDRAAATGWGLGVIASLGSIPVAPIWLSPVTAVAGCYFGYRTLAALGALKPGTRYPGDE